MPLTRDEIEVLADANYTLDDGYEEKSESLFGLLVDAADAYVKCLEEIASDNPAPFLGATPLDAAMNGLRENLDIIRGES